MNAYCDGFPNYTFDFGKPSPVEILSQINAQPSVHITVQIYYIPFPPFESGADASYRCPCQEGMSSPLSSGSQESESQRMLLAFPVSYCLF